MREGRQMMTVRMAALLIAFDGRVTAREFRAFFRHHGYYGSKSPGPAGSKTGSLAADQVRRAFRELRDEGLATREGPDFLAVDLVELAAWLADALDSSDVL